MLNIVTDLYDLNMLYEQVGKDENSLKRFVEIFLKTVPIDMEKLRLAIEANNIERARTASHKMKSSFMLMGSNWAGDLCFEIETITKNGTETEKLPAIYKKLSDNFIKMVEILKS